MTLFRYYDSPSEAIVANAGGPKGQALPANIYVSAFLYVDEKRVTRVFKSQVNKLVAY